MSVLVEPRFPADNLLQAAFKDQDLYQQRVSKLWQRIVFLQNSEFLRQCSQTTSALLTRGKCESFNATPQFPRKEVPLDEDVDVESPYVRPLCTDENTSALAGPISSGTPDDRLQKCCRGFRAQARTICRSLDSEGTESSSGGESDDELEIPPKKRMAQPSLAARRVARAEYEAGRAQIASRISWLAAQISDLEHRIRIQHDIFLRQKSLKRPFRFPHHSQRRLSVSSATSQTSIGSVDGDSGQGVAATWAAPSNVIPTCTASQRQTNHNVPATTPPSTVNTSMANSTTSKSSSSGDHAARTQALTHLHQVHRRRLLHCPKSTTGLLDHPPTGQLYPWFNHVYNPAVGPKTSTSCHVPTIMEQLDNSYHPVLSFHHDIPPSVCLETSIRHGEHNAAALRPPDHIRRSSFQHSKKQRARTKHIFSQAGRASPVASVAHATKRTNSMTASLSPVSGVPAAGTQRKLSDGTRRPKGISLCADSSNPGTTKTPIRRSVESGQNTPTASTPGTGASLSRQNSQSAGRRQKRATPTAYDINSIVVQYAAPSRVEKINYKEIETPRWRDVTHCPIVEEAMETEEAAEDISDDMFAKRHAPLEAAERIRFQGTDKKRRANRASSSVPTTPEASLTAPASPLCCSQSLRVSPGEFAQTPSLSLFEDSQASNMLSRKSSRKTPSFSRSASNTCDDVQPTFVSPWQQRAFPLSDTELELMQNDQVNSQQRTVHNAASQIAAFSPYDSMATSAATPRSSSNPSSPGAPPSCVSGVYSGPSFPQQPAPTSPADNWSVRFPPSKQVSKEVEEKNPPLLLKLTKHLSSCN